MSFTTAHTLDRVGNRHEHHTLQVKLYIPIHELSSNEAMQEAMCESIPTLFQKVEVLWEVDGEGDVWWKASMVELDPEKQGKIIGRGTLQYVKRGGHPSCYSSVEFLSRNLLRERKDTRRGRVNPAVSWRAVHEDGSVSDNSHGIDQDSSYRAEEPLRVGTINENVRGTKRKHVESALDKPSQQANTCHGNRLNELEETCIIFRTFSPTSLVIYNGCNLLLTRKRIALDCHPSHINIWQRRGICCASYWNSLIAHRDVALEKRWQGQMTVLECSSLRCLLIAISQFFP